MGLRVSLADHGLEDRSYTVAEWQEIEQRTGEKFEYHEGRLLSFQAMAGGSYAHSLISGNMIYLLGASVRQLRMRPNRTSRCHVHTSDLSLKIGDASRYVYPDAAVVCGAPVFDAVVPSAIRNPLIVAEVLSTCSAAYDSGQKFAYYASLSSLREYVLVTQDEPWVEVRSRAEPSGTWTIAFCESLESGLVLPSINIKLSMSDLYRGVDFDS